MTDRKKPVFDMYPIAVQTDETLLGGARSLDPGTLTAIHDAYYEKVYRYIAFRVSDGPTAEDLASEVFIRFLDALHAGRAPQQTLRGWLFGAASNVVADHYRKRHRHPEESLSPNLTSGPERGDPASGAEEVVRWHEVQRAMTELTDDQRQVLAMRFGLEMPIRDVANAIGKSEGAVKQLQARAVARLSEIVTPERSETRH